ncbi:hypothetical protein Ancab_007870, partial [Ancistrocladus abbreviatus]
ASEIWACCMTVGGDGSGIHVVISLNGNNIFSWRWNRFLPGFNPSHLVTTLGYGQQGLLASTQSNQLTPLCAIFIVGLQSPSCTNCGRGFSPLRFLCSCGRPCKTVSRAEQTWSREVSALMSSVKGASLRWKTLNTCYWIVRFRTKCGSYMWATGRPQQRSDKTGVTSFGLLGTASLNCHIGYGSSCPPQYCGVSGRLVMTSFSVTRS